MNRNVELALLAGASYESSRDRLNRIPVPEGWSALNIPGWPYGSQNEPQSNIPGRIYWQDSTTGFEAAAYTKGNEVVVSFAGTYFEGEFGPDMLDNNVPLGAGKLAAQLQQAAEFVVRLKQNPAMVGMTITLTGHSLGGGLASALAVMLDVQAVTFDPAPFRAAASMENARALASYLQGRGMALDAKLDDYTTSGTVPVPLGALLRLLGPAAEDLGIAADNPVDGGGRMFDISWAEGNRFGATGGAGLDGAYANSVATKRIAKCQNGATATRRFDSKIRTEANHA